MQGSRPGKPLRPTRTSTAGRVCEAPGCTTRLSVYNPKPRCWQHTDILFPNFRGKRLAKDKA